MKIGITYDLRDEYLREGYTEEETAEFDAPETIDAIESCLALMGHATDRIGGIHALTARLAAGNRWDLVFNYAEGMFGFGREAQVPALLDAFRVPYTFSDALVLALTLHKGMTKHVVRDMGFRTAPFVVIEDPEIVRNVRLPYPLFAKPVAGGTSVGISAASRVTAQDKLFEVCINLLQRFHQPVLVETLLTGRELTVGLLGTGSQAVVLGVMEVLFNDHAEPYAYSYDNKKYYEARVSYRLAEDAAAAEAREMALQIWRQLGCRDGGRIDFRCDSDGKVNFIEINPLAGLHPVHSDLIILARMLGMSHYELVERIVASACYRLSAAAAQ